MIYTIVLYHILAVYQLELMDHITKFEARQRENKGNRIYLSKYRLRTEYSKDTFVCQSVSSTSLPDGMVQVV